MPVFENARFITCEAEGEVFSKMAAGADGRILWLGDDLPAEYASMPRIDLGGAVAVPAFGDTHMHFESFSHLRHLQHLRCAQLRRGGRHRPHLRRSAPEGKAAHRLRRMRPSGAGGPSAQPRGPGPLDGAAAHHRQI